jgi:hypothetical protein
MNNANFDLLTRRVATRSTRRRFLQFGVLSAGGLTLHFGASEAEAQSISTRSRLCSVLFGRESSSRAREKRVWLKDCAQTTEPPTCIPGGSVCPMSSATGLADYSQCCSGSGVSSRTNPCLCCEIGRSGVRETGEICYPNASDQCCVGNCVVPPGEISGTCV